MLLVRNIITIYKSGFTRNINLGDLDWLGKLNVQLQCWLLNLGFLNSSHHLVVLGEVH